MTTWKGWHLSASILAPVVLSLLLVMAGVLGFVLWSTANSDQRALERETVMVNKVLSEQLELLPHDQESVAARDTTIINTKLKYNQSWVDANLGLWMHEYFGHDRAFLLNAKDQPVYAMSAGTTSMTEVYDRDREAYEPLVARMRELIAYGGLKAFETGAARRVPHVSDFAMVSGFPAIISVMPLMSDSGAIQQEPGSHFLHVSVRFLNASFAHDIENRYPLSQAGFSRATDPKDDRALFPILNNSGRLIAFFQWQPDRPGHRTLLETLPVLGIAFLVGGVVIIMLIAKLWNSTQAIEDGRRAAQHLAHHDTLTGLPNRSLFEETLSKAIGAMGRARPVTLFILDLDRFKQVNDTRGHHAGDQLIQLVAERLIELTHGLEFIARIGGDEFAVICHSSAGEADAQRRAERVIEAMAKPFPIEGGEVFVGVSIGIICNTDPAASRHDLVRKADIALYEAKAAGRNRAVVFHEHMNELLQLRHTVEAELREALRRDDQLSVAFQPLFDANGKVIGAEALARWTHPKYGPISPGQFIPVAESSGLIEDLGDAVLRRSMEMGGRWPERTIAVNISPAQLRNPKFQSRIFELLALTGMRPCDLELEITEGILLQDETVTTETLRTFRAAGIKIALDDFGTGYSSLNYLKRYAVDRIKIDRSFISQLGEDQTSSAIVQAMVTLAHAMGIEVTAEGVETETQLGVLRDMGCNTIQGYLLSAPVSPEKAAELFAEGHARTRTRRRRVA
ncbi:bifunctional diguanylate cyclase/phosphodiesterase [Youhaiella tibetensis]|uniref:bifunctional diguanylate cyclase/phosphodiesterase n=1 Tax=Paradevosia tibetensis TaxID=1447062 RepID=UPI00147943D8|nr:bifunctional diguanylate cyclase/phosphodiesterase [Youhaiella tibetensis]